MENQKRYMSWLAKRLGKREGVPEDWYSVKKSDFVRNFGGPLINNVYGNSPYRLLSTIYPNPNQPDRLRSSNGESTGEWIPWLFKSAPHMIWKDPNFHKTYVDWIGKTLGYISREDFYKLRSDVIGKYGGERLLVRYGAEGVYGLLKAVYPDFDFLPWKFAAMPDGLWLKVEIRRKYIDWLKGIKGISNARDLKTKDFHENNGGRLVNLYHGSPHAVLESLTPDLETNKSVTLECLPIGSRGFYSSIKNQRLYADALAEKLGFDPSDVESWYKVTVQAFLDHHGFALLTRKYLSSIYLFLKAVYPTVDWKPWKFSKVSRGILSNPDEIVKVLKYVAEELEIKGEDDWRRVAKSQLKALRVNAFFERNGGVMNVVQRHLKAAV